MRTKEEALDAFTPVGPLTQTQQVRVQRITNAFKELAIELMDVTPESADRTSALRKCLEAKFMCVQAITHAKELRANEKSSQAIESERQEAYDKNENFKKAEQAKREKAAQKALEAEQAGPTKKSRDTAFAES